MYCQTGQVIFVPEWPKMEFVSVFFFFFFYVGYILDNKNTLCNGCFLNRIIGLIQNLQVLCTMFISNLVPCHKFLEDVHEDSMQIPSQLAGSCATAFEGVRTPSSV
jgi:hypothetical protein